jgi:2,6-dihydroxypyridine 3-monooxygenase
VQSVSIIGGSIAGCFSALALRDRGFDVKVIERSAASLVDRGAAVVIPRELFSMLKSLQYIDADTPHLVHSAISFRTRRHGIDADPLWSMPADVVALRWGHLYQQLRKRIDVDCYCDGVSVTGIEEVQGGTALTLDNGSSLTSELVVAADGIHSRGREHVWGIHKPQYCGYILWRGLLEESEIANPEAFNGIYWAPYKLGLAGAYFIAGSAGETRAGRRTLNWGIYDKMPLDDLATLVPEFAESNPAAYRIGEAGQSRLERLATSALPGAIRDVVLATEMPFIQPIVDILPERLARGRTVLVGDAAAVLRPHSASGISKAVQNVLSLADFLSQTDDLDLAIKKWEASQRKSLEQLSQLTQSLGAGMVTNPPDWNLMRAQDMPGWWEAMAAGRKWFVDSERNKRD